jgi:hypothetical protein
VGGCPVRLGLGSTSTWRSGASRQTDVKGAYHVVKRSFTTDRSEGRLHMVNGSVRRKAKPKNRGAHQARPRKHRCESPRHVLPRGCHVGVRYRTSPRHCGENGSVVVLPDREVHMYMHLQNVTSKSSQNGFILTTPTPEGTMSHRSGVPPKGWWHDPAEFPSTN